MMLIGVPYDLYWFGDPFAVSYFVEKRVLEAEQDRDVFDYKAWLSGAYVHEAVNASLSGALSKHNKIKYPKEPHSVVDKRRRQRQAKAEAVQNAFAEFASIASVYNARMKRLRGGAESNTPAP